VLDNATIRAAFFQRKDALEALKRLTDLLDTADGFHFACDRGAVGPLFSALIVLDEYLTNSRWVSPVRERSREEVYAQQMAARTERHPAAAGVHAT
jgi:hypothetical protein